MHGDVERARADRVISLCERVRKRIAKLKKHSGRLKEELADLDCECAGAGQAASEARHWTAKVIQDCKRLECELEAVDKRVIKYGSDTLTDTPPLWYSEWKEGFEKKNKGFFG